MFLHEVIKVYIFPSRSEFQHQIDSSETLPNFCENSQRIVSGDNFDSDSSLDCSVIDSKHNWPKTDSFLSEESLDSFEKEQRQDSFLLETETCSSFSLDRTIGFLPMESHGVNATFSPLKPRVRFAGLENTDNYMNRDVLELNENDQEDVNEGIDRTVKEIYELRKLLAELKHDKLGLNIPNVSPSVSGEFHFQPDEIINDIINDNLKNVEKSTLPGEEKSFSSSFPSYDEGINQSVGQVQTNQREDQTARIAEVNQLEPSFAQQLNQSMKDNLREQRVTGGNAVSYGNNIDNGSGTRGQEFIYNDSKNAKQGEVINEKARVSILKNSAANEEFHDLSFSSNQGSVDTLDESLDSGISISQALEEDQGKHRNSVSRDSSTVPHERTGSSLSKKKLRFDTSESQQQRKVFSSTSNRSIPAERINSSSSIRSTQSKKHKSTVQPGILLTITKPSEDESPPTIHSFARSFSARSATKPAKFVHSVSSEEDDSDTDTEKIFVVPLRSSSRTSLTQKKNVEANSDKKELTKSYSTDTDENWTLEVVSENSVENKPNTKSDLTGKRPKSDKEWTVLEVTDDNISPRKILSNSNRENKASDPPVTRLEKNGLNNESKSNISPQKRKQTISYTPEKRLTKNQTSVVSAEVNPNISPAKAFSKSPQKNKNSIPSSNKKFLKSSPSRTSLRKFSPPKNSNQEDASDRTHLSQLSNHNKTQDQKSRPNSNLRSDKSSPSHRRKLSPRKDNNYSPGRKSLQNSPNKKYKKDELNDKKANEIQDVHPSQFSSSKILIEFTEKDPHLEGVQLDPNQSDKQSDPANKASAEEVAIKEESNENQGKKVASSWQKDGELIEPKTVENTPESGVVNLGNNSEKYAKNDTDLSEELNKDNNDIVSLSSEQISTKFDASAEETSNVKKNILISDDLSLPTINLDKGNQSVQLRVEEDGFSDSENSLSERDSKIIYDRPSSGTSHQSRKSIKNRKRRAADVSHRRSLSQTSNISTRSRSKRNLSSSPQPSVRSIQQRNKHYARERSLSNISKRNENIDRKSNLSRVQRRSSSASDPRENKKVKQPSKITIDRRLGKSAPLRSGPRSSSIASRNKVNNKQPARTRRRQSPSPKRRSNRPAARGRSPISSKKAADIRPSRNRSVKADLKQSLSRSYSDEDVKPAQRNPKAIKKKSLSLGTINTKKIVKTNLDGKSNSRLKNQNRIQFNVDLVKNVAGKLNKKKSQESDTISPPARKSSFKDVFQRATKTNMGQLSHYTVDNNYSSSLDSQFEENITLDHYSTRAPPFANNFNGRSFFNGANNNSNMKFNNQQYIKRNNGYDLAPVIPEYRSAIGYWFHKWNPFRNLFWRTQKSTCSGEPQLAERLQARV